MRLPRRSLAIGFVLAGVAVTVALTACAALGAFPATGGGADERRRQRPRSVERKSRIPTTCRPTRRKARSRSAAAGRGRLELVQPDDRRRGRDRPQRREASKRGSGDAGLRADVLSQHRKPTSTSRYTFTDLNLQGRNAQCLLATGSVTSGGRAKAAAPAARATIARVDAAVTVRIYPLCALGYHVTTGRSEDPDLTSRFECYVPARAGSGLLIGVAPGKSWSDVAASWRASARDRVQQSGAKKTVGIRTTFTGQLVAAARFDTATSVSASGQAWTGAHHRASRPAAGLRRIHCSSRKT